jgi:hypothetical protein
MLLHGVVRQVDQPIRHVFQAELLTAGSDVPLLVPIAPKVAVDACD